MVFAAVNLVCSRYLHGFHKMILKAAMFVLAYVINHSDCYCVVMNDGCSVPLSAPFPYKSEFRPACKKHDVCYRCGAKYGWSKADCDDAFRQDMETICESLYINNRRSFLGGIQAAFRIGASIAKWPFVYGKLRSCKHGADIYFSAVASFGDDSFRDVPSYWCDDPCVIERGSPHLPLA